MLHSRSVDRAARRRRAEDRLNLTIGRRIRLHRIALGWSQRGLADALGVSYQQVQKYESGATAIGAARLSLIARMAGADMSDFFAPSTENAAAAGRAAIEIARCVSAIDNERLRSAVLVMMRALAEKDQAAPR